MHLNKYVNILISSRGVKSWFWCRILSIEGRVAMLDELQFRQVSNRGKATSLGYIIK